ncbi:MAG: lipocalin-like domain-containing protein [Vampirovibrionales bacterium]|nr:lipocalin-like domain-containing protein [Vampirovibrionales bacterium]
MPDNVVPAVATKTPIRKISHLILMGAIGCLLAMPSYSGIWAKQPDEKPQTTAGFKLALPGYRYQFPHDHASHPTYKTEWWYYTGHLKSRSGKRYGYELTFFRIGQPRKNLPKKSAFRLENSILTHFALTDVSNQTFYFDQKLNRSGFHAQAQSHRYAVRNEDWSAYRNRNNQHVLCVQSGRYRLNLTLTSEKPPVIHGQNGISQKADCFGCASHYYSLTRLNTMGTLTTDNRSESVSGLSWMDHEFGSNQLTPQQVGWDWFSLQLSDHTELMFYLMRRKDGTLDRHSSGSIIDRNGRVRHLLASDFKITPVGQWKSVKSGGTYPMGWNIDLPSLALSLTLSPSVKHQELVFPKRQGLTYWEGRVDIRGYRGGKTHPQKTLLTGNGYVEMTGYAHAFYGKI